MAGMVGFIFDPRRASVCLVELLVQRAPEAKRCRDKSAELGPTVRNGVAEGGPSFRRDRDGIRDAGQALLDTLEQRALRVVEVAMRNQILDVALLSGVEEAQPGVQSVGAARRIREGVGQHLLRVRRTKVVLTIQALRELRAQDVISNAQLSAWDDIRYSVAHGSVLSPYSDLDGIGGGRGHPAHAPARWNSGGGIRTAR